MTEVYAAVAPSICNKEVAPPMYLLQLLVASVTYCYKRFHTKRNALISL